MVEDFEKVKEFNKKANLGMDPAERVNDLISELGELSKEILKSTNYGEKDLNKNERIQREFGDVYYSLLCLAEELGVEPENSLEGALEKYQERFEDTGSIGSNTS